MTMPDTAPLLRAQMQSAALDLDPDTVGLWQIGTDRIIREFFGDLKTLPTYRPACENLTSRFEEAVAHAQSLPDYLQAVKDHMALAGIATAGAGHLAFVPGGGLYIGAVADHLAAALNAFSADAYASPIAVRIHESAIRRMTAMVGYGESSWGDVTSGGSQATLTAFWAARRAKNLRSRDFERTVVYLSEHTHHCVEKALRILFGSDLILRTVPLAGDCMETGALAGLIQEDRDSGLLPFMIVATAGSTNLGRIDPLDALSCLAREQDLWFHVDAAYGGFFLLCEELKSKFEGIAAADSIVLDPHKGMFLPYGCGAVVLKDGNHLRQDAEEEGSYLQDRREGELLSPMDYSLELSRPFRSLRIWLAWNYYDTEVLAAALREKHLLAIHCRTAFATIPGIALIGELDLSIFAFAIVTENGEADDVTNQALLAAINRHPEVFLSSTRVNGRFVLRVAILSFRTHLETISRLIAIVKLESRRILEGQL